jgi:hypothetical protein
MILGQVIKDFPYPIRICPFCFKNLVVVNAIHWQQDKYQYKALYFCKNYKCLAYDEGARKAYARVIYSSDDAYHYFSDIEIPVQRWDREELVSFYK